MLYSIDGIAISAAARKLLDKAVECDYPLLTKAIILAIKDYAGMKRKNGQEEVDHSIIMTWMVWDFGEIKEQRLITVMLHDLVEQNKETINSIREMFGEDVARGVNRVSRRPEEKYELNDDEIDEPWEHICGYVRKMKTNIMFRNFLPDNRLMLDNMLPAEYIKREGAYYKRAGESAFCVLLKNVDKIAIFGNMLYTLKARKQKKQIIEYERFLAPLSKQVRKNNSEYTDALFLCREWIEGYIDNVVHQRWPMIDRIFRGIRKIKHFFRKISGRAISVMYA